MERNGFREELRQVTVFLQLSLRSVILSPLLHQIHQKGIIKSNPHSKEAGIKQESEYQGLPTWLISKEPTCTAGAAGDIGSRPESGRSHGGEHGNPLQYSCLESLMDRGAWQATIHGVPKSWTRLSDFHFQKKLRCLKGGKKEIHMINWILNIKNKFRK